LLIAFNKPWGVLCQFSDGAKSGRQRETLADYIPVPGVYPAGRLDRDSEGLLLLTDDGQLQHRIADPRHQSQKRYLVQVEGVPGHQQLQASTRGVQLKDGLAQAVSAELLARQPGWLWPRNPPIRERRKIPVSWLEVVLTEGRNRQVRRMCETLGYPVSRLKRVRLGFLDIGDLAPGQFRSLASKEVLQLKSLARGPGSARKGK